MTVVLSDAAAHFVDEQVKSGRFPSAQAAIDAAVARLRSDADAETVELRSLVDVGLAEADAGRFTDFTAEDVIADRRAALAVRQGRP